MVATNGVLLNAALRYADLGYPVFPCAPGDKHPITEHGFLDATTDPEQIERWWDENPHANIGIATEGLIVVDIDGAGNPWLQDNPERAEEMAVGPIALTPRGGTHRIFRQPEGHNWRCTESRLAPNVDTRADGGYIVAPPSAIGDKSYRWAPDLELDTTRDRLPEPPAWLAVELDRLAHGAPTAAPVAAGSDDANAIPDGQRNATLAKLAGAMRRVGMSRSEIDAGLQQVNRDRCRPPLSPAEVEKIAASIARYEPNAIAVAVAENHWDQMYQSSTVATTVDNPDPGPIPDPLLHVPGFINAVMSYTLATAPYPEPTLAFCGALALQALLAGRKVRDEADNRTNLYILGLANSGAGKDYARKVNQRIVVEAGLADCLGNSFASGEGLEDRLLVQPAALFQVDEMDGLLQRVNKAKDARHEQIVSMLLQMYSTANTFYVMRAKAGRDRAVIDQPCLSVFGTAVPRQFYEALSTRLMTNGFLARMLVLECQRRGRGRDARLLPVPAGVVDTARWWAEFQPGDKPGNLSDWHPIPKVVAQTPDAARRLDALRERADDAYSAAEERSDPVAMAIWARAYEKARRLALVYACSVDRQNPEITPDAAEWASAFVEYQTKRMLYMAGSFACESEFDSKRKRLLEQLQAWRDKHGDAWMPFWAINRKLPWSSREHEEVRETLVAQRLIDFQIRQTGGRPGPVYRLVPTAFAQEALPAPAGSSDITDESRNEPSCECNYPCSCSTASGTNARRAKELSDE